MKKRQSYSTIFDRSDQLLAELEVLLTQLETKRAGLNRKVCNLLASPKGRRKATTVSLR